MVATIHSAMLLGVEAQLFTVEVDLSVGMPVLSIIGDPKQVQAAAAGTWR